MPIYMSEDLSDLAETTEIKRAVPQMPTGMEKDEECEHHLQRAIFSGTVIPTPEVTQIEDLDMYRRTYPAGSHMPKQLVRMHPFALEPEHPDYDADSEDEEWLAAQGKLLGVDIDKFEAIIDKLDKNSNFSVITLPESKSLLKESDAVVTAVYDYWLSKRLRLQHSLIPAVKTEAGSGPANDPYIAFRRRKDKMQTRKNRKNDETSYEKMLKLKKDLSYAHTLFQMVQRREHIKLQLVHLHMDLYQKRFEAKDFSGSLLNEVKSWKRTSASLGGAGGLYNSTSMSSASVAPAFMWSPKPKELKKGSVSQTVRQPYYLQDDSGSPRKERRHYKKRKRQRLANGGYEGGGALLSSDDEPSEGSPLTASSSGTDENPFSFKRQRNCSYLAPIDDQQPWDYDVDEAFGDENRRFYAAYVTIPRLRSVGFARRRLGRGGRLLLDRADLTLDDVWSTLDYTIKESGGEAPPPELAKYKPRSPCTSASESDADDGPFYDSDESTSSLKPLIEVENLMYPAGVAGGSAAGDRVCLELELNAPLKHEATYALLDRIASHIENCNRDLAAYAATTTAPSGRWADGTCETTGSILERWTKSHKNGDSVGAGPELGDMSEEGVDDGGRVWRRPRVNFSLEDGETIGCSTFRTVTGEYFEDVFGGSGGGGGGGSDDDGCGGKNGGCGGGNGVEYALEKGNNSMPTSLSQLLSDCESLGFRDALLRKT